MNYQGGKKNVDFASDVTSTVIAYLMTNQNSLAQKEGLTNKEIFLRAVAVSQAGTEGKKNRLSHQNRAGDSIHTQQYKGLNFQ